MRKLLIPLLAALALPTAVNAETVYLECKFEKFNGLIELEINPNTNQGTVKSISNSKREVEYRAKQFIKSDSISLTVNTEISTDTYTVSRIDGSATQQSILMEPYKKMFGELGTVSKNGICNNKEKVNANNNNFYFKRGVEKQNKGDSYGAISDFTKAIEINPQDADAYNNRGWIKEKLKVYNGAISDFTKAIEINPQDADAYYNRGKAKHKLEDYDGAISDFTKAIEINPQHADAYYNRGNAKHKLEDYDGAISDYTKAIEINPQDADAYNNRGWIKEKLKVYNGAISDFTKAIEINPQDADAYYNRGKAKHKLEDYDGAISDYTKGIEINPSFAVAYSARGITKGIGFKDIKGACDDFKKAASLGYQYAISWLETSKGKWCKDM